MLKRFFEKLSILFTSVNQENSSMAVQCIAPGKCEMRHTAMCDHCKNNIGEYKEKNFYEAQ